MGHAIRYRPDIRFLPIFAETLGQTEQCAHFGHPLESEKFNPPDATFGNLGL